MITLILGSKPHVIEIDTDLAEIAPELLFSAANRIGGDADQDVLGVDLMRLFQAQDGYNTWDVLRRIRVALDTFGAPSMTSGDCVYYTSSTGEELGGLQCLASGWTRARVTRGQARNGGHLCHV